MTGIHGIQLNPGPAICSGTARAVVVPSPSWPQELKPHAHTEASAVMPNELPSPTAIAVIGGSPATCANVNRRPPGSVPAVHTVLSLNSATSDPDPNPADTTPVTPTTCSAVL